MSKQSTPRIVHPRMETPRNAALGQHLDDIYAHCDYAIHKGYCYRNGKKLDAALAHIIEAAEAARKLLRPNGIMPETAEMTQAEFGRRVLLILAGEQDWSPGTLDEVAENAYVLELAETDENSMFKIIV